MSAIIEQQAAVLLDWTLPVLCTTVRVRCC
jgi:hypothetical protein